MYRFEESVMTRRQSFFWPVLIAGVLWLTAVIAQANHVPVWFAEPFTGRKVVHYSLSLDVGPGQRRAIEVPQDCADSMGVQREAEKWISARQRPLWVKLQSDCRFYQLMHRHPHRPSHDFVSQLDLFGQPLMMWPTLCDGLGHCRGLPQALLPESSQTPLSSAVIAQPLSGTPGGDHAIPGCHVVNGVFRGRLERRADGSLACVPDAKADGFRVLSVDYCDIDGDDFMDAIVRYTALGKAQSRQTRLVGISRKGEDAPWRIVELEASAASSSMTPSPQTANQEGQP